MIHVWDSELIRKVLHASDSFRVFLHPNATAILGPKNIAFMHGPDHVALRKALIPLFTRRALAAYLPIQEGLIRHAFADWLAQPDAANVPEPIRFRIRDLNIATSTEVFVGAYMDDAQRAAFNANYLAVTLGFLAFPIALPGTALWRAIQARKAIVRTLKGFAAQSKARMRAGEAPRCLLDFWMEAIVPEIDAAAAAGEPVPPHSSDQEIAEVMLDFLFASQDASTSSLIWSVALLAEHPTVLARVRAEQAAVRPHDEPVSYELIEQMPYTRAVVREVLRLCPPATAVPHVAVADAPLGDTGYVVPKGAIVFPSIWHAHRLDGGVPDADRFDPDRYSSDRAEDVRFAKRFLTFGHGPHYCMGREYAMNHLVCFVALLAPNLDWTRHQSPDVRDPDELLFTPTVIPPDGVRITLRARDTHA